jgi:hypothetical protein
MVVFIEIIEGFQIGTEIPLKGGDFLGLQLEGDHQVGFIYANEFNKIAHLDTDNAGKAILMDVQSPSGLWINGIRVKQVLLKHGVIFQLENQFFKVNRILKNEASYATHIPHTRRRCPDDTQPFKRHGTRPRSHHS